MNGPIIQPNAEITMAISIAYKDVLTLEEGAYFLNYTPGVIKNKVKAGQLPYHRETGKSQIYFLKTELVEWVRALRNMTVDEIESEANGKLQELLKTHA